jgi:hypothetical protein
MMKKKIKTSILFWGIVVIGLSLIQVEVSFGGTRLAVVSFQLEQAHDKEIVRCRSCGNILEGGPIEGDPTALLTRLLWELFQEKGKGFDLISPGQVEGVFNTNLAKGIEKDSLLLMKAMGTQLNADYMLWGSVFHYQERKGTSYGVKQPASVALDLHLFKVKEGKLVWRAQWAKTQKSLSENLLEAESFFKGKMRWVTVEELSRQGLEEMLKDFPSADVLR